MKKLLSKFFVLTFIGILMTSLTYAQMDKSKRASPAETATGTIDGATITINYSSPAVKGRTIWGDLVPYDQVWRLGANEATTFETSKDIEIEDKKLPAGKYSLYAIPGENEWTFIFNSVTEQNGKPVWGIKMDGSTTEVPANDVLRVTVKPKKSESFNERMKFDVNDDGFDVQWENLKVTVEID
jgi:hypothetical protein